MVSTLTGVNGPASAYSGPTLFFGNAANISTPTGLDFIIDNDNNSTGSQFSFRANGDGAAGTIDIMTISEADSGKVGIGSTTPTAKLDVNGSFRVRNFSFKIDSLQNGTASDSMVVWRRGDSILRKISITSAITNIYNKSDTLTGNRDVFMKSRTLAFDTSTLFIDPTQNSIGVGTITPNSSSILDLTSTTDGLLVPRMTTAQRSAIVSPANGLLVYDLTTNCFWVRKNTVWVQIISGAPTLNTNNSGNSVHRKLYSSSIRQW